MILPVVVRFMSGPFSLPGLSTSAIFVPLLGLSHCLALSDFFCPPGGKGQRETEKETCPAARKIPRGPQTVA